VAADTLDTVGRFVAAAASAFAAVARLVCCFAVAELVAAAAAVDLAAAAAAVVAVTPERQVRRAWLTVRRY